MKKLFIILFLLINFIYADVINNEFTEDELTVLKELNLDELFVEDTKFKTIYTKMLNYYSKKDNPDSMYIFVPTINNILIENGIPKSMLYVAAAESRFISDVKSNKSAAGVWQFTHETAKLNGLVINKVIDERYDIEKSSKTAALYLQNVYSIFGKWYLAAVAYNAGATRVAEGIARARIDAYCAEFDCENNKTIQSYKKSIKQYQAKKINPTKIYKILQETESWDIKPNFQTLLFENTNSKKKYYLPDESVNYIKTIVALSMIDKKLSISMKNSAFASRGLTKVKIKSGTQLKNVADDVGLYYNDFIALNRHLKFKQVPKKQAEVDVYIPSSRVAKFFNKYDCNLEQRFLVYNVKLGDTIQKIASSFGVTKYRLASFNHLDDFNIEPFQKIVIPEIYSEMIIKNFTQAKEISTLWSGV